MFPEKWCILLITTEEYVNKIDELAQQFDKIEYYETIVLDIFNKDNDLLKFYENLENHLKNL